MLFFELLQVAVGQRDKLSFRPNQSEWKHLYQMSKQHALLGICYCALQRLPQDQWPEEDNLVNWIWQAQRTQEQNQVLNQRSLEIYHRLTVDGFDACLLKGQGNALMYGDLADFRQSGDVDMWIVPSKNPEHQPKKRVIDYVHQKFQDVRLRFHHIDYPVFDDVEVEIHFLPVYLNNPVLNHRLNAWYKSQRTEQMSHFVNLDEPGRTTNNQIAVPTLAFNALYQLLHIYKHVFEEGIGLRQMMDYYYVLKGLQDSDQRENAYEQLRFMIRRLKLERLSGAIMYILQQVFGMPDAWLVVEPNHSKGLSLLSEIMQTGNFGHYDTRYKKEKQEHGTELHRYWRKTKRNLILAIEFPHEGLWEPLFRLYHFFWRTLKLWKI